MLGGTLLRPPGVWAQTSSITTTAYGGVWEKAVKENFVACFENKTGARATVQIGTPAEWFQKVRATIQTKPAIDVLLSGTTYSVLATELGIAETMTEALVPNLKNVNPMFKERFNSQAVAFDFGGLGLAYNKERVRNPPDSLEELVERVAKGEFGRKVHWPPVTHGSWGPDVMWLLNDTFGGTVENIEPGLQKVKAMKPYIYKFFTDNASPGNALLAGEIDLAIWFDGRLWGLVNGGAKQLSFKYLKPKALMQTVDVIKVKNSPDIAWEYVNCMFDPVALGGFIKNFPGYGVTNQRVVYAPEHAALLDPSARDFSFTNFVIPPYQRIVKVLPMWVERWNREIGA